jgi:hypothetical protein
VLSDRLSGPNLGRGALRWPTRAQQISAALPPQELLRNLPAVGRSIGGASAAGVCESSLRHAALPGNPAECRVFRVFPDAALHLRLDTLC